MDFEELKNVVAFFENTSLQKLRWKGRNGSMFELEKPTINTPPHPLYDTYDTYAAPPLVKTPPTQEGFIVTSPLVGIFYRSPQPGASPFVSLGDTVEENSVLCIVEAMKVMNEIKLGKSGRIAEIFFEDMTPVEFGSPLFRII